MPEKASIKTVVFYGISSEFFSVALKLTEKLYENKENSLFLCKNKDEVQLYDSKLWTYSKLSFVPHGSQHSINEGMEKFCHTWFSTEVEFVNAPVCLIHNGLDVKNDTIKSFEKIVDIFDTNLLADAKSRAAFYKDLGFSEQKCWEQIGSTWEQKELIR